MKAMTKTRNAIYLLFLLLALASEGLAASLQGDPGSVEGIVTRAGSSEGVAGVKITLSAGPIDPLSLRALSTAGQTIGFFIPETATPTPTSAPTAATTAAPTATPAAPALPPTPVSEERILQQVLDSATSGGMSPGNAALTIALNNFRDQTAKFRTITDSGGHFTVSNVPPGQYTVRSERDGYFGTHGTLATVTVSPNQSSKAALSMVQGATVGGNIRDEDGEPVVNATVQIFQVIYPNGFPTLGAAVSAKTNFRGDYRLFWMPAGEYFVGASREVYATQGARVFYPGTTELTSAMQLSLKSGEDRERIDFVLTSARMVKISGVVTSTAPPPAPPTIPAGVTLTPAQQAALASAALRNVAMLGLVSRNPSLPDPSDNPEVSIVTLKDNRAEFEFTAPAGAYEFAGLAANGGFGKVSLDIADRDQYGVALTILPPVTVQGSLAVNGSAPDLTKLRISNQPDNRLDAELGGNIGIGSGSRPVINPDGTFSLPVPANSRMRPTVLGGPLGIYVSDIRQDGKSVFDSGIEVSAETHPIQILLNSDGGTVKGSVQDASGKLLTNAMLVLVPAEAKRKNRALYRPGTSDNTGHFTIASVPPGEYKFFAWPSGIPSGSYFSATFLARYEERGRPVTVGPSATVTMDGVMVPFD